MVDKKGGRLSRKLCVTQSTYDLITKTCVKEFLMTYPEYKDINITQDFIVKRIAIQWRKL